MSNPWQAAAELPDNDGPDPDPFADAVRYGVERVLQDADDAEEDRIRDATDTACRRFCGAYPEEITDDLYRLLTDRVKARYADEAPRFSVEDIRLLRQQVEKVTATGADAVREIVSILKHLEDS